MAFKAQEVNLQLRPETNIWRRTYLPVGSDVSDLKSVGNFTDEELTVIAETPFLASRIRAAAEMPTPIGWNDTYKGKRVSRAFTDARQAYNFAVNNPTEFLISELPAYLGAGSPEAATQLVSELAEAGETPENISALYESALEEAPKYTESFEEYSARKAAERGSGGGGAFGWLVDYVVPAFTTVGAIAGGPVGAAVANSLAQLSKTGKVDPVQTAVAAGGAYIGQELLGPATPEVPVDTTMATSTAAPGSFQAALPELGVQTAATTPAFTAAPGSFQAALPSLIAPVNAMGDTAQGLLNQDLEFVSADAAQLYETTGSVSATQQNLIAAGVDPTVAAEASNLAALGGTPGSIAKDLASAFPGEAVITSEGLLSAGSTLDDFAKDIADISSTAETGLGVREVFDALRGARSIYNLLNPPASGQAVGGGLLDDTGFQPTGIEFPLAGVTQVQRAALPSLGPVISPYISKERLSLLSQPSNLLGYQPNFSLLG